MLYFLDKRPDIAALFVADQHLHSQYNICARLLVYAFTYGTLEKAPKTKSGLVRQGSFWFNSPVIEWIELAQISANLTKRYRVAWIIKFARSLNEHRINLGHSRSHSSTRFIEWAAQKIEYQESESIDRLVERFEEEVELLVDIPYAIPQNSIARHERWKWLGVISANRMHYASIPWLTWKNRQEPDWYRKNRIQNYGSNTLDTVCETGKD